MLYLFESVLASLRLLREKDIVKVCVSINVITYLDPLACLFLGLILQVHRDTNNYSSVGPWYCFDQVLFFVSVQYLG